jgi:hypothetical protein
MNKVIISDFNSFYRDFPRFVLFSIQVRQCERFLFKIEVQEIKKNNVSEFLFAYVRCDIKTGKNVFYSSAEKFQEAIKEIIDNI